MPRHSHQDALNEKEFEALLDAADRFDDPYDVETRFVLTIAGRLGFRAGELAHMRDEWIDWDREVIEIPHYQACEKGKNGGICGYCRKQAKQQVRKSDGEISLQEALDNRYSPKTATSARAVPFGFNDGVREAVEEFFFHYNRYPKARVSINRRVDDALIAAGMRKDRTYPHALRATAASWHAYRGVPAVALQALMGWRQLDTATKYIRMSGSATAKALENAHS